MSGTVAPQKTKDCICEPKETSFHRRPLPESLVAFSSPEGRELFKEALANGFMEGYFTLSEQFVSQSEPAYCGPATISMVLNALNIDPNRLWKGRWRWFVDEMFDCCAPMEEVKKRGITFNEFACLAKCNGASVVSVSGHVSTLEGFRKDIQECTSQQSVHMVVSYSRQTLGQTGTGHYSPVGGYHLEKDLVLVMDVARFKYSPHWVPLETLWRSMQEIDVDTQKSRGYFKMTKNTSENLQSHCRITTTTVWSSIASILTSIDYPLPQTSTELIGTIAELPHEIVQVLNAYPNDLLSRLPRQVDALQTFFSGISKSKLCEMVRDALPNIKDAIHNTYGAEILCIILLSCPNQLFDFLSSEVKDTSFSDVRCLDSFSSEVQTEIMPIKEQMIIAVKGICKKCKPSD